jgi:zinc D-Ala-D-Ala carboxypeptidase
VIPAVVADTPTVGLLTPNFRLAEFFFSEIATRNKFRNEPSPENAAQVVDNLRALCENVLEPIRDLFGAPVIILSGFRSLGLNRYIKGAVNSQHMLGQAADIRIPGVSPADTQAKIWNSGKIPFDQLILEFCDVANPFSGWVHVSYAAIQRKEVLQIDANGTRILLASSKIA